MLLTSTTWVLLINLALGAPSSPQPRADSDNFGLYAYGPGIGGFPVFNLDDRAYVGVPALTSNSSINAAQSLLFTLTDSTLVAYPNTTASTKAAIDSSGATVVVHSSGGSQFEFNSNSTDQSGTITSGWKLYGGLLLLNNNDTLVNPIYAVPTSIDGVWTLNWNVSDDSTAIPVSVKNSPPSSPPSVN